MGNGVAELLKLCIGSYEFIFRLLSLCISANYHYGLAIGKCGRLDTRVAPDLADMKINKQAGAWAIIYCSKSSTFLLGKRSEQVNKPGLWNFFGGHIDPGENPRDALLRELAEETRFNLSSNELIHFGGITGAEIHEIGHVEALRELHYFLLLTDREIEPHLNYEHTEFHWFKQDKLPHGVNRPTAIALNIGLIQKALQITEHQKNPEQ